MDTKVISIYPKFACIGGKCPHTCCKGWQITVDEDTAERYKNMRGAYGRALRFHMGKSGDFHVIRKQLGVCPHHNSDRLCQFQVNGTKELMPLVCRMYPRECVEAGEHLEVTLELSCISAARLFLDNPGRLELLDYDGDDMEITWDIDNEDENFYEFLVEDRRQMLDFLWDGGMSLAECWQILYAYVYKEFDLIIRDKIEDAKKVEIATDREGMGIYYLNRQPTYAFFSTKTIDRMIFNHIDYGTLWLREPKFFRLIRRYIKRFSSMYVDEADDFFDKKVRRMMQDGYEEKYISYFSYCIQQLYIKAFETYFTLRQLLFSILYVQLLMMFDLVDYLDNGEKPVSIDRQSEVLMLCEQGIRHNPSLTKNLLEIIREEFL